MSIGDALSRPPGFDPHELRNQNHGVYFPPAGHITPLTVEGEELKDIIRSTVPTIEITVPAYPLNETNVGYWGTLALKETRGNTCRVLPALLRYVDNELIQTANFHDLPPNPHPACSICFAAWNVPAIPTQTGHAATTSTFLPLSPCGHWVHYRCFIWIATMNDARRNQCPVCDTRLFEWDGINALTLAMRTGLELDDNTRPGPLQNKFGAFKATDRLAYEAECAVIDSMIHDRFFAHLSKLSKFSDKSPDLVQCFYDVLEELSMLQRPKSRWLQYNTKMGGLLWGMLVLLKMRRYLVQGHAKIQATQGWIEFEESGKALQRRIMEEVHGP